MALKIINAKKEKLGDEDYRRLAEMEEHPEVAKWDIPAFEGDLEKAYLAFKESCGNLPKTQDEFLVAKIDERVVGFAGIHRLSGEIGEKRHVGEIGIIVHPDFQRKGIGTQLLRAGVSLAGEQGFRRLEADTLAHNKAMKRILEKAGFRLEGVRRKRIKRDGDYYDEACYAIVSDEQAHL